MICCASSTLYENSTWWGTRVRCGLKSDARATRLCKHDLSLQTRLDSTSLLKASSRLQCFYFLNQLSLLHLDFYSPSCHIQFKGKNNDPETKMMATFCHTTTTTVTTTTTTTMTIDLDNSGMGSTPILQVDGGSEEEGSNDEGVLVYEGFELQAASFCAILHGLK